MRLFIDTNVMLDLIAHREPFYDDATMLFSLVDRGKVEACVAAIDEKVVRKAIAEDCRFTDIEDAMQYYAAIQTGCDCIITRNKKDFTKSDIPVMPPKEFLDVYPNIMNSK